MDEIVRLRVLGLPPQSRVTLAAEMSLGGYHWASSASFLADRRGSIDLARDTPASGSYNGRDPMGLFWSMTGTPAGMKSESPYASVRMTVRASIGGRELASTHFSRAWLARGVRMTPVKQGSVVGMLFDPGAAGNGRGVIVLSGSEGGIPEWEAALLASHGFTVLAPAYFGESGRPERLIEIPLEDMKEAMQILRAHPSVNGRRIAVLGSSKGGELALLLGATYPEDVAAVVSYASGALIGPGLDEAQSGKVSSWSFRGSAVPYARCRPTPAFLQQFRTPGPIRLRLMNEPCLSDPGATAGAFIPVREIKGDVLLITGGDDQTGPTTRGAQMMVAARRRLGRHRTLHLDYPLAGHAIYSAYIPTTMSTSAGHLVLGGTPAANAAAQRDSWPRVIAFLRGAPSLSPHHVAPASAPPEKRRLQSTVRTLSSGFLSMWKLNGSIPT
jgi:dienelactone hydrolase